METHIGPQHRQGLSGRRQRASSGVVLAHTSEVEESAPKKEPERFMGVALRGWATTCISLVAIVATSMPKMLDMWNEYQTTVREKQVVVSQNKILQSNFSAAQGQVAGVGEVTRSKSDEIQRHLYEKAKPIQVGMIGGQRIVADYYPSDGCVRITRDDGAATAYGAPGYEAWDVDPRRADHGGSQDASAAVDRSAVPVRGEPGRRRGHLLRVGMQQGNCLGPGQVHPGTFTLTKTQPDACHVRFERRFADGCVHNQMYDACTGRWDPGIHWTACAVRHHP